MNGDIPDTLPLAETGRLAELGQLTAELIHELRNPLFAMKSLAQLLQAKPEQAPVLLPTLLAQISTMEQLLQGYGDLGKRPSAVRERFDLQLPLSAALVILEHRAHLAGVQLQLENQSVATVYASALAFQQAVVNLGQNAIDAVREQRGEQKGGWVRLTVRQDSEQVVVSVLDNGPGLSPMIQANLFTPFQTTKAHGTGLGLVLSREILTASGASLSLKNTGHHGTCWEIILPLF